ncbi:transcriptional regulator [Paenibacillus sp. HJGM_3]|uniref:transcriptional regulator n=1 Tax=Paenibacillus sp. HJGM_3 TaxID=3379816 RepID=UPI00385E0551
MKFNQAFEQFMHKQITGEKNVRRRERLERGLGKGNIDFLRIGWYPTVGHFEHLFPEWEVRDLNNGYRYIDHAFLPAEAKGAIEVQGYGSHARDIEVSRFKDLCLRHSLLALDNWVVMHFAYPSLIDDPKLCQQLILSFVGKFLSIQTPEHLSWLEAETIRLARRMLRPLDAAETAAHLRISTKHARTILHRLVDNQLLSVASGNERARTYRINF